jgi:hypothetical protein
MNIMKLKAALPFYFTVTDNMNMAIMQNSDTEVEAILKCYKITGH